jgi:hypothetical protein
MGAMPPLAHTPRRTARTLSRDAAAAVALLVLASVAPWAGLSGADAATPVGTSTLPVPASAQPQPPSAGATGTTATATTPTTTFAPAGASTAPAATSTTPAAQAAAPTTTAPTSTTTAKATVTTTAKKATGGRSLSTGSIVIAVLAALLVLACLTWALARRSAFEPHWLLSLRHAMAEAGFRASATWSEFADWARLGR